MLNHIPNDMLEVTQKTAWLKAHGQVVDEATVVVQTVLDGANFLLEDALEGPYWAAKWQTKNAKLVVLDVMNQPVGYIVPRNQMATFSADFEDNAALFWDHLTREIQRIVGHE